MFILLAFSTLEVHRNMLLGRLFRL